MTTLVVTLTFPNIEKRYPDGKLPPIEEVAKEIENDEGMLRYLCEQKFTATAEYD